MQGKTTNLCKSLLAQVKTRHFLPMIQREYVSLRSKRAMSTTMFTHKSAIENKNMLQLSGSENIPFDIVLKTTRAKNQIVDMSPSVAGYFEKTDGDKWKIKTTLFNKLSLNVACGFYIGLSDEIDICSNKELKRLLQNGLRRL